MVVPVGVGRVSSKLMAAGREIPTVGVTVWVEGTELSAVVKVETSEVFSTARTSGCEIEGINSVKPTSRASIAPLVSNKCAPPEYFCLTWLEPSILTYA